MPLLHNIIYMAEKESAKDRLAKMIQESSGGSTATAKPVKVRKVAAVKVKKSPLQLVKLLNTLLIVGVVACVALLLNEFSAGSNMLNNVAGFGKDGNVRTALRANLALPPLQRLSYYLADINSRNIFQPYETEAEEEVAVTKSDNSSRITKKTRNYRLVGVAWFDTVRSAAAMIEDTNKNVTYFVHRGEKIGDVTVKTIYADSVELGYQNEEIIIQYDKSQM